MPIEKIDQSMYNVGVQNGKRVHILMFGLFHSVPTASVYFQLKIRVLEIEYLNLKIYLGVS